MKSSFRGRDKIFTDPIPKTKGNGNGTGNNCWKVAGKDNFIRPLGCTLSKLQSHSGKKDAPTRDSNKKKK